VRKPILVYFGLLGEWVDVALLEELATRHPEWSLVLIGNVVVDITSLAALPNVVFIGAVPYQELPEYVAFADVLLLPYIVTGRGHSITPLKLREYIATGKPVVTTAIPECYLYRSVITVAESREAFFTGVSDAVKEGGERAEERRRAVVKDSWRQRAETFSSFLAGLPRRV
jgi:glycosyltransferase involved in cell wall biosynthesis